MKDPEELECLSEEEIAGTQEEIEAILAGLTKNEIVSIKGMILPPMFTFNVLKLIMMLQNPTIASEEITWNKIKKDLLASTDIVKRRCQLIKLS